MNSFERVAAALSLQQPDRVPVYPILCGINRKLVGADYPTWSTDAEVCAAGFLKTAEEFDIDCLVTLIDLSVECDAWGQKIIYPENEAAHPDYSDMVIQDIEDYEKIQKVDYRQSKRMMMHIDVVKRLAAEVKGKKPIVAFVFGPLGTLSMLRNQQDMYMDLYDDPDAVREACWNVARTLADYVGALCDAGADAIMWDTLFASGSIMSKAMWQDMEAEQMSMLAKVVRDHGCMNLIHNCGQKIYFDVQIEAVQPTAISFLYPPDDCKDFAECKEKYGDKVALIGAVTPANAVIGTDEEWDKQCTDQIDAMAAGGGFMLATGCEYPANATFDRAQRMIDIAKTYGVYSK
ncbi:MAG: uroporphyrinogen decarboxylase [Clostridia bacterium]|nr:uroporphyrinogen decarboxylase [Clostridia bacterium]